MSEFNQATNQALATAASRADQARFLKALVWGARQAEARLAWELGQAQAEAGRLAEEASSLRLENGRLREENGRLKGELASSSLAYSGARDLAASLLLELEASQSEVNRLDRGWSTCNDLLRSRSLLCERLQAGWDEAVSLLRAEEDKVEALQSEVDRLQAGWDEPEPEEEEDLDPLSLREEGLRLLLRFSSLSSETLRAIPD